MMSAYEMFLFALSLLFGLVLRRAAPVVELSLVEQLERKVNTMENQKRKLKRQMAELRARLNRAEARLLEDSSTAREGQAQVRAQSPVIHADDIAKAGSSRQANARGHQCSTRSKFAEDVRPAAFPCIQHLFFFFFLFLYSTMRALLPGKKC